MKTIIIFLFLLLSLVSFSQTEDSIAQKHGMPSDTISFDTILDIANATKDGIYLNGYVVDIDYNEAKKLDGKKIRVTGKVTVIKGLKNLPKEYDKNGNEIHMQGRLEDTKYIKTPKIETIND